MIIQRHVRDIVKMPERNSKPPKTVEQVQEETQKRLGRMMTSEEIKARQEAQKAKQGQFAWAKLHSYTGCDPQWLDLWQYLIPGRCDCRDGYQKIIEEMPPDLSTPEAFFAWGVALHNAVNKKLGKPEITIEEAYSIWRNTDGQTKNSGEAIS